MVGGEAADFEAGQAGARGGGKTIVHVGPAGSGQTVKAANQLIVAGNIELLGRGIVSSKPTVWTPGMSSRRQPSLGLIHHMHIAPTVSARSSPTKIIDPSLAVR